MIDFVVYVSSGMCPFTPVDHSGVVEQWYKCVGAVSSGMCPFTPVDHSGVVEQWYKCVRCCTIKTYRPDR